MLSQWAVTPCEEVVLDLRVLLSRLQERASELQVDEYDHFQIWGGIVQSGLMMEHAVWDGTHTVFLPRELHA